MSSPTNPNMAADLPPIGLRRVVYLQANRPPTVLDSKYRDGSYYEFNTEWRDLSKTPPQVWKLATINSKIDAIWFLLGPGSGPPPSGPALQFTPSTGSVVFPNISTGNVNVFGGTGITVTGTTETLTIALSGSAPAAIETITGDDGTPESPSSNNFNILGAVVANATHAKPVYVLGSAATETVEVQQATTVSPTPANNNAIGLASYNANQFTIDSTSGMVSLKGSTTPPPLLTLSDDVNTTITSDSSGNIQLQGHIVEQGATKFSTVVAGTHLATINPMSGSRWIVDSLGFNGTHTTIASAITSATAGDTIVILQGTYTENLSMKNGVNLAASGSNINGGVTIHGQLTIGTGSCTITGINFTSNGASIINSNSTGQVRFYDCSFVTSDQFVTTGSGGGGTWHFSNTFLLSGTASLFSCSTNMNYYNCYIGNGGSTTASALSGNAMFMVGCFFGCPVNFTGGTIFMNSTYWSTEDINQKCLIANSAGSRCDIKNCQLYSGTSTAVTVSQTCTITNCSIETNTATVIDGAGTLRYTPISFTGTGSTVTTSTVTLLPFGP